MILKQCGELGDKRIPNAFRDERFEVFVKHGVVGWVLLAIDRDNIYTNQTPSWSYQTQTCSKYKGHLVKREFQRRLLTKTDFSGRISDLSIDEIDDVFEQAYVHIVSHHNGDWHIIFLENGKWKDDSIVKGIQGILENVKIIIGVPGVFQIEKVFFKSKK